MFDSSVVLLIVSLIGFLFFDGVYISAVTNYAIQSELNISLLHSICMKVKNRKYHSIDLAIKVSINFSCAWIYNLSVQSCIKS